MRFMNRSRGTCESALLWDDEVGPLLSVSLGTGGVCQGAWSPDSVVTTTRLRYIIFANDCCLKDSAIARLFGE